MHWSACQTTNVYHDTNCNTTAVTYTVPCTCEGLSNDTHVALNREPVFWHIGFGTVQIKSEKDFVVARRMS